MATCFIFTETLTDSGCVASRVEDDLTIAHDVKLYDFTTLKNLCHKTKTILIIPTQLASIHEVSLPLLSPKKLQTTLPFALEDNLVDDIETLHFAYDKTFYHEEKFLVVVTNKLKLIQLLDTFASHDIYPTAVTLDWFALNPHEGVLQKTDVLIHHQNAKGALDEALFSLLKDPHNLFRFQDSLESPNAETIDLDRFTWFAKRLSHVHYINLLQGALYSNKPKTYTKGFVGLLAGSFLLWIGVYFITHMSALHHYKQINNTLDTKIAAIYRQYFPDAKQIISPKFRLTQWLKGKQNNSDDSLWHLLGALASHINPKNTTVESAQFQKNSLTIQLKTDSFLTLETLQTQLKHDDIQVKQQQASTEDKQVLATLELSW